MDAIGRDGKSRDRGRLRGSFLSPVEAVSALLCAISFLLLVVYIPQLGNTDRELLFLYFQPLLPMVFMLWLWGHNVQSFHAQSIEYEMCFNAREKKYLMQSREIFQVALLTTAMFLGSTATYSLLVAIGSYHTADYLPLALYFLVALLLVAPINWLHMPTRLFFAETLQRVLLPFQEVSWSDFLLADIMTSLSKSTGDLAKMTCGLVAGPKLRQLVLAGNGTSGVCQPLASSVLVALCLPYIIRFIQCLIVYRTTGNRGQVFNAIKYSTAFPALVLTAMEHEYHVAGVHFPYMRPWLVAMAINTIYSFYWDVEMDWDMPWFVQPGARHHGMFRLPGLKSDAFFSPRWYTWAIYSNLVLRMMWAHRLVGDLENHATVALAIALLEAFRRYQWAYIRVETEIRKLRLKHMHEHSEVDLGISPSSSAGGNGTAHQIHHHHEQGIAAH